MSNLASKASHLPESQLETLRREAERANSDALVILHRGEIAGIWQFGKPKRLIETMSVTKSVVNWAVGRLLTKGAIPSVDEPVHSFYPEWRQGRKNAITLRHLMNHTSGLQNVPVTTEEIYPSADFVQFALCAELSHDPGKHFSYNNKAVNLIAGIVERASGRQLDMFVAEEIFEPLGIGDFIWARDRASNPHAMSGLSLLPEDLATIGKFVLDRGRWQRTQIIDEQWFDVSLQPSVPSVPSAGLLWWLIRDLTLTISHEHLDALIVAG